MRAYVLCLEIGGICYNLQPKAVNFGQVFQHDLCRWVQRHSSKLLGWAVCPFLPNKRERGENRRDDSGEPRERQVEEPQDGKIVMRTGTKDHEKTSIGNV